MGQAARFELVFQRPQFGLRRSHDGVDTADFVRERSVANVVESGGSDIAFCSRRLLL